MTAEGKLLFVALGAGARVSLHWLSCVLPVPMATGRPVLMLGGGGNTGGGNESWGLSGAAALSVYSRALTQ